MIYLGDTISLTFFLKKKQTKDFFHRCMLARDQFKIILSLCEMLFPLLLYSFYYCMMSGGWKRYSVFFNHFISHKNNCCCGFLNAKYCFPAFAKNSLSLCFQTYCLSRALRARSRIQKHLNFVRLHTSPLWSSRFWIRPLSSSCRYMSPTSGVCFHIVFMGTD